MATLKDINIGQYCILEESQHLVHIVSNHLSETQETIALPVMVLLNGLWQVYNRDLPYDNRLPYKTLPSETVCRLVLLTLSIDV